MKNIIFILMLSSFALFSQTYKNQYVTKVHLANDPESGFEYLITAPQGLASSYTFSLPPTIGSAGEVLTSLGNGSYTWTNLAAAGASPGGSNTNVQFALSNAFSGSNSFSWNNTLNRLYVNTSSGSSDINASNWAMSGLNGKSGALSLHTGHASGYRFNFKPNSAMTTSATITFPTSYGSTDQYLVTDGQGNLYWTSAAIGGSFDCIGQGTGGGSGNTATSDDSFVGGGTGNSVNSTSEESMVGGGSNNEITDNSEESAIVSGNNNLIAGDNEHVFLGAGAYNQIIDSEDAAIGAGRYNTINSGDNTLIGAGEYNYSDSENGAIYSGSSNTIKNDSDYSIITTGKTNTIRYSYRSGIMSGENNTILGTSGETLYASAIAGGKDNTITNHQGYSFIGGGQSNYVSEEYSNVAGGFQNYVTDNYSSILGGYSNTVTSKYSMAFGYQSEANSDYTLAIGRRAVADNQGAFVLADNTDAELNSSATNRMEMRFTGGYRFFTNTGLTTGMKLDPGSNSWAAVSDRNLKNNILKLDYNEFYEKISDLEIFSWAYKFIDDKSKRNYSPMAQDFYKLFGNDEIGHFGSETEIISDHIMNVGLASLKGLINKYETSNTRLKELNSEQERILQELNNLEKEIIVLQNKLGGVK